MPTILGPVDVTENNPETYTSSHLSQFAWTDDPEGSAGLLFVEFQHGSSYIYVGAGEEYWSELRSRAHHPERYDETAGEYFTNVVKEHFSREGLDYVDFEDVLD